MRRVKAGLRHVRTYALRLLTTPSLLGTRRSARHIYLSDGGRPTYFGYHDKTPVSGTNDKILAASIAVADSRPDNEGAPMRVGYFAIDDELRTQGNFEEIGTTTTWCWQQGCMLQWDPRCPDRKVFFNTLVEGAFGAVLVDIESRRVVKEYANPIYALDPTGRIAATLNFARLGCLRPGYGYKPLRKLKGNQSEQDGLFVFDLMAGERRLLVDLNELTRSVGDGESHYLNHATFSPDGSRIAFFHVCTAAGVRRTRLCTVTVRDGQVLALESQRLVSHYCWRTGAELLATTRDRDGRWHYTLYDLDKGRRNDLALPLRRDGHPMFHPLNKNLIVTDTYPDRRRDQHLCIVDISEGTIEEPGTFFSPMRYDAQVRCDLHPRWDREGRFIVVDSAARGRRELVLIDLASRA